MNPLKRLLLAICRPFAKRREPPRLVVEFRRTPEGRGVTARMNVENTTTGAEYELKCIALFLFALSRGLAERDAEIGHKSQTVAETAQKAYTLACIVLWEAGGEL